MNLAKRIKAERILAVAILKTHREAEKIMDSMMSMDTPLKRARRGEIETCKNDNY